MFVAPTSKSLDTTLTILVVDENINMRHMVRDMLRNLGFYNFVQADDGESAWEKLTGGDHKVDVVLSNWDLPHIDGFKLLRAIREDDRMGDMPFIIVTSKMDEATVAQAGEVEVDAYIVMPFTQNTLREKLEQVIDKRRQPSAIEQHLNIGLAHIKNRDYSAAEKEFRAALAINSKSPRTYAAMGALYEKVGEPAKAKEMFETAVKLAPKYLRAYESLARLAKSDGDLEGATQFLKKSVAISPKNLERQLELGQTLIKTGKADEAKGVFKKTMTLAREENANLGSAIGDALMQSGMVEDAQEFYGEALDLNPEDIHLYNRLGIAYRRQGKYKEAVANYQKALSVKPEDEALHYNLGRAFYEAGDKAGCERAMREALKANPNFPEAKEFLVKVLKVKA